MRPPHLGPPSLAAPKAASIPFIPGGSRAGQGLESRDVPVESGIWFRCRAYRSVCHRFGLPSRRLRLARATTARKDLLGSRAPACGHRQRGLALGPLDTEFQIGAEHGARADALRSRPLQDASDFRETRRGLEVLRHENGRLAVKISADVDPALTNTNAVVTDLNAGPSRRSPSATGSTGRSGAVRRIRRKRWPTWPGAGIVRNALIGSLLVFVCLVLVFDLRVATWVTVGIPLSFIGSLLFFAPAGLTLHMGTIFGFFLMVGIVVDDAVVVGESIAGERERGKGALEAAISGTRAVASPITIGVCTTILGFLPFLFITTTNYQIVSVFPYIAFFVLLVSLIEAFFILPAHLSHEKRWSVSPLRDLQDWVRVWLDGVRDHVVVRAVSWSVRNIALTITFAILVVAVSVFLLKSETVRIIILDKEANISGDVQANLQLPIGAPFAETLATAERFVEAGHAVNEQLGGSAVHTVSIIVGNTVSSRLRDEDDNHASHLASVKLHLHDRPIRSASPAQIERLWRRQVGDISYLDEVEYQTTRVRDTPTVAYALKHDDAHALVMATRELRSFMTTMPGLYEISDSVVAPGKRHFEIQLTPAGKAAGLTPALVGTQLRANFNGAEVQRIHRGHDEVKVMVRYPRERRRSLIELASERILRPSGGGTGRLPGAEDGPAYTEVPPSTVARLTERRGLATLTRIDGKQAALVNAQADTAVVTPIQARRQIESGNYPRVAGQVSGTGSRAPRERPGLQVHAGNPGSAGSPGVACHVRAHGGLPAQLLEAARCRGGHSRRVRRRGVGPLDAGVGLHGDVTVRRDRSRWRHSERCGGAAGPLQHDSPGNRHDSGDRRGVRSDPPPLSRGAAYQPHDGAGIVTPALRAKR